MHPIVYFQLELVIAKGHFRALDSMDTSEMDGPTYCAWASEHENAWQYILSLQDQIREKE